MLPFRLILRFRYWTNASYLIRPIVRCWKDGLLSLAWRIFARYLFMKGSISIINISVYARLKNVFGRRVAYLASSPLSLWEDQNFILEDFISADEGDWQNVSDSSANLSRDEVSCEGSDTSEFVDKSLSTFRNEKADAKMEAIKSILLKRGWNLNSQNGFDVDVLKCNTTCILNDLFHETSDAALALYFFNWWQWCMGSEHSIRSTCRMVHILVSGNMNYKAVELLLHLVRNSCKEEGPCDLIVQLLSEVHTDKKVLETTCSMLVDCCIKEHKVTMAINLTCQMEHLNIFPSMGVCNSLLQTLLGSNQSDVAWDFLEKMLTRGMSLNATIISLFINKYCSEGNIESGWELLMAMKKHGIIPDVVSYTIVIDSLCKGSFLKEATSILFKMTQLGIPPDSVSLSSILDGYCKVGKSEEVINILNFFKLKLNIFVYNSFLSKLCTDGNMVKASIMFHEISQMGLIPDCVSYTTIIGGFCKKGDINKAFQYFGKMLKNGINPSVTTFTLLIDTCCKSGDFSEAESLFQKMRGEALVPDVVTYNTLMDGYGKKGCLHKVFELLDMMRLVNISPDIVTYNILIHSLVIRGYINEAKDIVDELIRRGYTPNIITYTNVIDGLSRRGNFEEAFLVWSYMSEHHVKPDVVTCSALLNGYCKALRIEEANVLFLKMIDVGLEPDLILYNTLIHGFCSVGNTDDACKLLNVMVQKGILPNNVTHEALITGFEKKLVRNPVECATLELQQVLLKYREQVNGDDYIAKIPKPIS